MWDLPGKFSWDGLFKKFGILAGRDWILSIGKMFDLYLGMLGGSDRTARKLFVRRALKHEFTIPASLPWEQVEKRTSQELYSVSSNILYIVQNPRDNRMAIVPLWMHPGLGHIARRDITNYLLWAESETINKISSTSLPWHQFLRMNVFAVCRIIHAAV